LSAMYQALKTLYRRAFGVAALVRSRLRSRRAQISDLRAAVTALLQYAEGERNQGERRSKPGVERLLLQNEAVCSELDRLANLYESAVCRTAANERSIEQLIEQVKMLSSVQGTHLNLLSSTATVSAENAANGQVGSSNRMSDSLKKQFETMIGTWGVFESRARENLLAHYNNLAEEYEKAALERDHLRNLRSELMRLRQDAARPDGIAKTAKRVYQAGRLLFPDAILKFAESPSVVIVDVGAQNLSSEDHIYAPLQRAGATKVICFEPLVGAAKARQKSDPDIEMLNHFVGRGGPATFHIGRFSPTSSLLEPDMSFLSQFVALPTMCEIVDVKNVNTTRLDDIKEVADCDFLKIDVQGAELDVLKGAARALDRAVTIHCDVEFSPLYKDQALFGGVDLILRTGGFELIDFINAGYAGYVDLPQPLSQSRLLWAEAIYFKSPSRVTTLGSSKLMTAAFIAHVNYGMYDLAAHYLSHYDRLTGSSTCAAYARALEEVVTTPASNKSGK
jgi:FkbM family methyltransferase